MKLNRSKWAALVAVAGAMGSSAAYGSYQGYVSYTGGTYQPNFATLEYSSTMDVAPATAPVLDTPSAATFNIPTSGSVSLSDVGLDTAAVPLATGLDGWWSVASVSGGDKYGASSGGTSTGGLIAFGPTGGARTALGYIATNSTGNETLGVAFENTSTTTYTSFTVSETGQLWRQTANVKTLNFGYLITTTNVTSPTSGSATVPSTSATTADTNLNISFATGTAASSTLAPEATTSTITDTISGLTWAPNTTLWLTWTAPYVTSQSQGLGISSLSFSANSGVPEPTSVAALGGCAMVMALKRRRPSLTT